MRFCGCILATNVIIFCDESMPELARSLTLPERAPGWDVGPERRIDDGRTLKRVLARVGIATLGLIGAAVLVRRTRSR